MYNMNIAAQLYTVRNFCKDEEGIRRSAEKIAKIGYRAVQVSGIAEIPDETMRRIMDENGLKIVATHFGMDRYENDLDAMIDKHLTFGCTNAGIGYTGVQERAEGFIDLGRRAEKVAVALEKHGIHFIVHNHAFELCRYGDKTGLDLIYENSSVLNAELDVHWIVAGGGDPTVWIRKLAGRMRVIHYKDFAVDYKGNRIYKEIGEGNMNWQDINDACAAAGIEYCIVEQDDCYDRDPFDSLAISYRNLKAMGLKDPQ